MSKALTTLRFDDLAPGQTWGAFDWSASDDLVRAWEQAMGERCGAGEPGEPAPFPPGLLLVMFSNYMDAMVPPRPPGMIYARQQLDFGVHPRIGDVLTTTMTVVDKAIKRGRRVVRLATSTANQRGETVLTGVRTVIWGA